MNINDILLKAKQKGIHSGTITIPIVKGILRLEKVEYRIFEWADKPVDSVVDNSE